MKDETLEQLTTTERDMQRGPKAEWKEKTTL